MLAMLTFMMAAAPAAGPDAEQALDLARFRGQVVLVDFWASWCSPCRSSIPWLNAMQAKYGGQGLVIIGINVDKERIDADRFLAETPIHFEVVYDPAGRLPAQYDVPVMPSSFVFDRSGALVVRHAGFLNAKRVEYEATLRKLLLAKENPG
ncbi:MAG TPA: TlpA disulfide reductase family protein [Steroidobacteraceae bacterium]